MAFECAYPTDEEFVEFILPTMRAFGVPEPNEEELDDKTLMWEPDRSVGAVDDGEWIGGTGAYSFDLTLPGGTTLPAAGVTMVGVSATHRRRGVLRQLMERQLDDVVDTRRAARDPHRVREQHLRPLRLRARGQPRGARDRRDPVGLPGGSRAVGTWPDAAALSGGRRRSAPGRVRPVPPAPGRSDHPVPENWELRLRDRERWRDGASGMFIAVHEDADGQPDGLATYRIKEHWTDSGLPQDKVVVEDLCGTTSEVEAVLWRLLLDVDLASTVVAFKRPVDDPIKWRLADPRRAQTNVVKDWLWLRVLDVPRALEGRGYEVTGQLVLDVHDPFRPSTGGRFLVDVDPKSATCARTDAEPDLALEIDDLGAIYLGGVAPSVLAAAGRIKARSAEVVARADDIFRTTPGPFSMTGF